MRLSSGALGKASGTVGTKEPVIPRPRLPVRVRQSLTGRSWYVESAPDETEGACQAREVLCQCAQQRWAERIATALNAAILENTP